MQHILGDGGHQHGVRKAKERSYGYHYENCNSPPVAPHKPESLHYVSQPALRGLLRRWCLGLHHQDGDYNRKVTRSIDVKSRSHAPYLSLIHISEPTRLG